MPARERILSLGLKDPERQEPPNWLRTSRALGHRWVGRLTRQRYDGAIHLPPPPPPCPAGWRTGPPSFVGVGGQRCGTTRWFDLIASHPEIVPPLVTKELDYFDRFHVGGFTDADATAYHAHFPRDGDRKVGEWSPLYMAAPWVPRLLARAAPDTRILVLLRDPVERYLSGLQHNTRVAYQQGAPLSELAPLEGFMRGLYYTQLTGLLAHFDRSQILVLQYERCTQDPLAELQRTFTFLGLSDTAFAPDVTAHPHRQTGKPYLELDTLDAYVQAYREDVLSLARDFPEVDLGLWPNFAHLVTEGVVAPKVRARTAR
ncbi:MAG: sulfotransferase family protein [Solirubrobacteraceae bacterium]